MSNKHHEISRVAYELYEKRGCIPGYDFEDWLEAERIIFMQPVFIIENEAEAAPKSRVKRSAAQPEKEKKPRKAAAKTAAKTPNKTTAKTTTKTTKKAPAKKKP